VQKLKRTINHQVIMQAIIMWMKKTTLSCHENNIKQNINTTIILQVVMKAAIKWERKTTAINNQPNPCTTKK